MPTSYALYSLFTCTWHYARSIHWFPLLHFLDYQSNVLPVLWVFLSVLVIYLFLIVVLHNSVLYASETTLQVGMKFCLVLAESLTELDTALHATSIKEQLPFLCNTDWVSLNIKPSDNPAMFIHVETRCFPLRRNMQKPAQSNKPGCFCEACADDAPRLCWLWRLWSEMERQNEITGKKGQSYFLMTSENGRCIK